MNEIILSNNLLQLMRIHGNLSVSDLARLTNIPQPTLHHILSGSTKNPRKKSLDALAEFFSVSIEQLIEKDRLPNVIPEKTKEDFKISTIPIIQWGMLKNWPLPDNNVRLKETLLDKKVSEHSFALLIPDASLEPMFPQNTLLIFDFGKQPTDRDFVIVHIVESDIILLNRFFSDSTGHYIKQDLEDGNAKLIKLDPNTDRIIGILIEARIQY